MNKITMYKKAMSKVAWPAMSSLMNLGKGFVNTAKPLLRNNIGRGALLGGAVGVIKGSTGEKASVGNAIGSGLLGAAGGAAIGKGIGMLGKGAPALQSTQRLGISPVAPKLLNAPKINTSAQTLREVNGVWQ